MLSSLSILLPYFAIVVQILFIVVFAIALVKKESPSIAMNFIAKYSILLSLLFVLSAVLGSLFYSEIIGYEPCKLCWWQRGLIYPSLLFLGIGLIKKEFRVFRVVVPLMILSSVIALYQSYTSLGGASLLPCTANGGSCSKVYVKEFGYLTIPVMSLTISLWVILIAWINKKYKNEDSNS